MDAPRVKRTDDFRSDPAIKTDSAALADPESRRKILDLIDHMLKCNIYGVEDIINAHDR